MSGLGAGLAIAVGVLLVVTVAVYVRELARSRQRERFSRAVLQGLAAKAGADFGAVEISVAIMSGHEAQRRFEAAERGEVLP